MNPRTSQRRRSRSLSALIVCLGGGAALMCVQRLTPFSQPKASFAAVPGADSVAFDLFRGNRIYLSAVVNGQPTDALLDSGAGMTTMDRAFAEKLGVKPQGTMHVHGASGTRTAGTASGVNVTVGSLHLSNMTVLILDLSSIAGQIGRPLPLVLGKECFDVSVVDINFSRRTVAFHDPKGFQPPMGARRLPLEPIHGGVRGVPVSIEGRKPVLAAFDLGLGAPLVVSHNYLDQEHLLDGRPASETIISAVGGTRVSGIATLRRLEFGGIEMHEVPALFNRSSADGPDSGVAVGMGVLGRFRLITDYEHDSLFVVPDQAALATPFLKDRSGLRTTLAGDRLIVAFVAPSSPAAAAGWRTGEQIRAVDSDQVGPNFLRGSHSEWSSGRAGDTVELTLADGSKRFLVLKDYF